VISFMEEKEVSVFIEGENICFIPQNSDNINLYVKWLNDPKVRIYSRNIVPLRVEDIKKWFEPQEGRTPGYIGFEIWHKKDKKAIGNVGLGLLDWINGFANVGVTIGEPAYWNKNIATEATELIIEYAFNELNLNKLHGGVCVKNIASWSVAEKIGFQLEGIREQEWYVDGEYLGLKAYCLLKEDWMKRKKAR
jgi:RimJ/RimL family protein N-acetyltransferase